MFRQLLTQNRTVSVTGGEGKLLLRPQQATTSGTSFDFSDITSKAKSIAVQFNVVSLSGTDNILVQLGDSGGLETTGYVSSSNETVGGGATANANSTSGFIIRISLAGSSFTGVLRLGLIDPSTNAWVSDHSGRLATTRCAQGGGNKLLDDSLNLVRVTRTGTDTFDAGAVNILIET